MYLIFTFGINHPHFLRFASLWFGAQKSVLQSVLKVLAQIRNSVKLKMALGNFLWGMTANPWNEEEAPEMPPVFSSSRSERGADSD